MGGRLSGEEEGVGRKRAGGFSRFRVIFTGKLADSDSELTDRSAMAAFSAARRLEYQTPSRLEPAPLSAGRPARTGPRQAVTVKSHCRPCPCRTPTEARPA